MEPLKMTVGTSADRAAMDPVDSGGQQRGAQVVTEHGQQLDEKDVVR
jgi:hypothetical protein